MPNKHLTTKQIKGRCYCGDIAYEFEGEGTFMQCHCRECQYISARWRTSGENLFDLL